MEKHANIDLVRWFVSAQMVCYKFLNSYTKVEWKTKKMVEVKEKVFLLSEKVEKLFPKLRCLSKTNGWV